MQIIGCDVAKASLDINAQDDEGRTLSRRFDNRRSGFHALLRWIKEVMGDAEVCVVLEATGVYHLPVAAYLVEHDLAFLVANPGRARAFATSQNQRNKNDRLDSFSLRRYGQSLDLRQQHLFVQQAQQINTLKALLSRLTHLEKDLQREQNRLEKCDFIPDSQPIASSIKRQIRRLKAEIKKIDTMIDEHIESDEVLNKNNQLLCSIKGIANKTARWLLPLLHNKRFKNARQLAAFLGLTPCHQSSGTMILPGRLSGHGNRMLRSKLYFPAVAAATHDPAMAAFYQSLLRRGAAPKQAIVAVMRKLVHVAFGVIKHQQPYDPNFAT